jgi:signal transduction histidine kinase
MQLIDYLTFTTAGFYALVAIFMLIKQRNQQILCYSVLLFLTAIWILVLDVTINNLVTTETAQLLIKLPAPVSLWIAYFLILFIVNIADYKRLIFNRPLKIIFLINIAFTIISIFANSIIATVKNVGEINEYVAGNLYLVFISYICLLSLYIFYLLIYQNLKLRGIYRVKIFYISVGLFCSLGSVVITNVLLPILGYGTISGLYGTLGTLIMIGFLFYAEIQQKFLVLTNFLNNIISIVITALVLNFSFYGLVLIYSSLFGSVFNPAVYILVLFACIGIAIVISVIFETKFIRKKYDPIKYTRILRNRSYINLSPEEILEDFVSITEKLMGVQGITILSTDNLSENYRSLFKHLERVKHFTKLYLTQFSNNLLSKFIDIENISGVMCIYRENKLIYLLVLGNRINFNIFDNGDISALNESIERLNIAVNFSILSNEQKTFNQILEERLEEATKELQTQKNNVEERFRSERDMMGIMGHELRTPLTRARGFLELIIAKSKLEENTPIKEFAHYLDNIYSSFKREIDLVQTMLSTSHVDNKQLNLNLVEVDLNSVIEVSIADLQHEADQKGLALNYHKIENIPHIICDSARTMEVTNNLISNAIKYTSKGQIDLLLNYDDEYVYFGVKDTGEGIPENEIPNIGKKFYRVNNYLSQNEIIVRPGGTGLGAYITKAILEAAGGSLRVESKIGEGSVFTAVFRRWK